MTDTNTAPVENLSLRQLKINDLREDIVAAEAKVQTLRGKLTALENEEANEAAIENLTAGSPVAYVYGRALNKRVLTGSVVATAKNDKGAVQIKISYGTGFEAEFHVVDASALLMTTEQVEQAEKGIAEAKLAAEQAAAAAPAPTEGTDNG